jgi:hypothetical protein
MPACDARQQGIELGAPYGDGPAVRQGHRATSGINGRDEGALRK